MRAQNQPRHAQPMRQLLHWLEAHANADHYLFSLHDLRALFAHLSDSAFKTLLSRTVKAGYLERVCRGIYIYPKASLAGLTLYHAAASLRADNFNYISLETALSDAGVISQIPLNWITLMTSGRSSVIDCGHYGHIEFIHTCQQPTQVMHELHFDESCRLWRASVPQALKDMKSTHRNMDLIDWDIANEFI